MSRHNHHIVPRHAGGNDDPDNLVSLTIPDHAEAHRVLWETHGRVQDKVAWLALSKQTAEFEQERVQLVKRKLTGVPKTTEHRAKIGAALKGRRRPERLAGNIGNWARGRERSQEHRARIGDAHRGKTLSPEHKEKLRQSKLGNQNALGHLGRNQHSPK